MLAPLTWLKDYVKIDVDVRTLADKLLHAGFEVEEIRYLGEGIENVVVGKILSCEKHPNADRLTVCSVAVSEKETLQIVTGADNIKAGDFVPVAKNGALLPGGKTIQSGELRGVASCGMLCSGGELNLAEGDYPGAGAHGILILDAKGLKIGQDIQSALGLDEYVLDIGVTANRPDCQSILGIAREVGAVLGRKVKLPETSYTADRTDQIRSYVSVSVEDAELCPRYLAKVVKDIRIAPSPKFVRDRLRWAGLRPINNIVDITNFVLLELGQPMHAFDLAKLESGKICVRRAKDGERIVTLDGKDNALDGEVLVIADGDKPVALAGIMGGENSGITESTKTVMFECAKFNRQNIRRVSKRLNVRSDSSAMYERGVYAWTTAFASERSLHLIEQLKCGTIVSGGYDCNAEKKAASALKIAAKEIDDILGIAIPGKTMVKILNDLSIETELADGVLNCKAPPYREDIAGSQDIAEEIIRMYGYDNIEGTLLTGSRVLKGGADAESRTTDKMTELLTADGFNEIVTYSFVGPKAFDQLNLPADSPLRKTIKLLNPLGADVSEMRTTLAASMLSAVAVNLKKKNTEGRLFEFAKTYFAASLPLTELPDERPTLSIASFGRGEDFYSMKGETEAVLAALGHALALSENDAPYLHPGRSAALTVNGRVVGRFGEVHPDVCENFGIDRKVYLAEIDLSGLLYGKPQMHYREIPKFQRVVRDLAVVAEESLPWADVVEAVEAAAPDIFEGVELFDVYRGSQIAAGAKSFAFKLAFRAAGRTLVDAEVDAAVEAIVKNLAAAGAELRG